MIQQALEYAVEELNGHFNRLLVPRPVRKVAHLSTLLDQKGDLAVKEENALLLVLVNVQEEKKRGAGNGLGERRAPLDLNLYVMLASYFPGKLTGEALGYLSMAIEFFYLNHTFSPGHAPGLDPGIHSMSWDIFNVDFASQSNIWGATGAKLMPSVFYKVRLCIVPKTVTRVPTPRIAERGIEGEVAR